jgi:hypothetical protein
MACKCDVNKLGLGKRKSLPQLEGALLYIDPHHNLSFVLSVVGIDAMTWFNLDFSFAPHVKQFYSRRLQSKNVFPMSFDFGDDAPSML